jgi:hypothetical protein
MKKTCRAAALIASALIALASCATLDQQLTFKAIDPGLPASASASLLVDGNVVAEGDYREVAPIALTKKVEVPLKEKKAEVDLNPELKAAALGAGGDAVAKLKISIDDFDSSDYGWVYFERSLGLDFALVGGVMLVAVATMPDSPYSDSGDRNGFLIGSGCVAAGGLALLGGSFIHEKYGRATYTIGLDGVAVKLPAR